MAAYDFPLLSLFWSMLEFFALVIWFFAVAAVIIDIFRSHDLSGWAKALWFVFVLFMPLIGLLAYLVVRGPKMTQRAFESVDADLGAVAPGTTKADELGKLADLRDRGAITTDEFEKQKAALLS
jgi:putative oligomerization/nucleic acid binding protein/phospholipase D-like protein